MRKKTNECDGNSTFQSSIVYFHYVYPCNQAPSEARGVVIGGQKHEKSRRVSLIDSEMAGPISMKLSGIDRGNSVAVLGQKN